MPPFLEKIPSLPEKIDVLNSWFIEVAQVACPLDPSTLNYDDLA